MSTATKVIEVLPEPVRERDKYDEAIEYLTAHPEHIQQAWMNPCDRERGGCLFQFVAENGEYGTGWCGCLLTVAALAQPACSEFLTEAIRADERIPIRQDRITVEHLPIFADWQRRIDAILDRK